MLLLKGREKVRSIVEVTVPALFTLLLAIGYWLASDPSSTSTSYTDGITFNTTELVTSIPDFYMGEPLFFFCQNLNITANTSDFRVDSTFIACPAELLDKLLCLDGSFADVCYHRDAWRAMNAIVLGINALESSFIPYSLSSYLALARWVYLKHPSWDNFGEHSPRMSLFHTGYLMLVGPDDITSPFRSYIAQHSELARRVLFPRPMTADDAAHYAYENGAQVWAVLDLSAIHQQQYTIRMNLTATPFTFSVVNDYVEGLGPRNDLMYLNSGFLTLQNVVNRYIAEDLLGASWNAVGATALGALDAVAFSPMPTRGYSTNNFLQKSGHFVPLVMTFGFLYALSRLLSLVVEEKETKIKEAMLIMGLTQSAFYASWVSVAFTTNVVACIICATAGVLTFFGPVEWTLLFVLHLCFACTISCMGFVLSALFDRSKVAALVGPLLLFITTVPHYAIPAHTSVHVLYGVSLLPCTAYAEAINAITDMVTNGVNVGWRDIHSGEYTIAHAIGFMLFDCLLYLCIALYLDLVLPGEHGRPRHPCFCFPWCRNGASQDTDESPGPTADIEHDAEANNRQVQVRVAAVTKRYSTQPRDSPPAVDRLSFDICLNEIFVLLGHNGAGKSTTMHMITGMIPPSSGDVEICGHSINKELAKGRSKIGFCPQHNVLWPSLSVRDHLVFFGIVKGEMSHSEAQAAARDMASRVDLLDQFHVQVKALSGGQKRKLSVAIALVADSSFVLLDEPTAGMDVNARRHLWNLLLNERKGRCVLLSTHYMDEADLLGDRIAIMDHGRLHTLGSSLYLKSQLGSGYTLHLVLRNAACAAATLRLIQQECPQAAPVVNATTGQFALSPTPNSEQVEANVSLPREVMVNSLVAARVFELLENDDAVAAGVVSYGLSLTTLEDVFVKITNAAASAVAEDHHLDTTCSEAMAKRIDTAASDGDQRDDVLAALIEDPMSTAADEAHRTFARHFTAMMLKRFHCAKRDRRAFCFQVVLPIFFMAIALLLMLLKPPAPPKLALDSTMYETPFSEVLYREAVVPNAAADMSYFDAYYTVTPVTGGLLNYSADVLSDVLVVELLNHTMDRWFAIANKDEDATFQSNVVVALHNVTALHAVPQSINALASAVLRRVTRNDSVRIVVVNHPLPMSKYEKQIVDAIMQIVSALFILIPFTFIPAQFVSYVVKEREIKAKHQQWVSGANTGAYWTATVVFDLLTYLFTEMLAIVVFLIFHRTEFIGDAETFAATFCLFFFYGLSMVPASCLISFLFDKAGVAQNAVMLANFFCGFLLVLAAQILAAIDSTRSTNETLCWVYRLIPSYCLGEGIIALTARQMSSILLNGDKPPAFAQLTFSNEYGGFIGGVGTSLSYMGATAPVFFLALFILEKWRVAKYKLQLQAAVLSGGAKGDADSLRDTEDADVHEERLAVGCTANGRPDDCLTVLSLTKKFTNRDPPKVAVRDVSFGVHRGEIFAFLGTNGAGKTTTMGILTGDVVQTSGRALIGPWDVSLHPDKSRMLLGYCPQFDALLPEMTAVEHMYFYCRLKGVPEWSIPAVSDRLLHAMGVYPYKDKPSRDLSGGNKRKLSIAIALVGDPPVVLLDEPSAGMDPLARRTLWSSLRKVAESRSVVLTTHHLEEVEALAHRAAIMVSGSLRCVGSLQHLKTRFGGGAYEMEVRCVDEASLSRVIVYAQRDLDAVLLEQHGVHGHFTLNVCRHLSKVFKFIADRTLECGVTNFAVNQTSIEQVFLRISAENEDHAEEAS